MLYFLRNFPSTRVLELNSLVTMGNISHLGIKCAPSEFDEVLAFYLAALKPLG